MGELNVKDLLWVLQNRRENSLAVHPEATTLIEILQIYAEFPVNHNKDKLETK